MFRATEFGWPWPSQWKTPQCHEKPLRFQGKLEKMVKKIFSPLLRISCWNRTARITRAAGSREVKGQRDFRCWWSIRCHLFSFLFPGIKYRRSHLLRPGEINFNWFLGDALLPLPLLLLLLLLRPASFAILLPPSASAFGLKATWKRDRERERGGGLKNVTKRSYSGPILFLATTWISWKKYRTKK